MSRDNDATLKTLMEEIQTLRHLLEKVDDGLMSMDLVTEQSQKIINLLPVTPDAKSFPILDLLMCRPLTRIEIPSEVLIKLITSGLGSVNTDCNNPATYFCHAVNNAHYGAVRILVQLGLVKDCLNYKYRWRSNAGLQRVSDRAIVHLAREGNAPLDIFDLIATPQNLNHAPPSILYRFSTQYSLPLHSAVSKGHVDIALRLIRLGADVNIPNKRWLNKTLPLECYINWAGDYHDNLFTHLIPSQPLLIMNCFKTLARNCNTIGWSTNIRQPMIKRLMQYTKPVAINSIRCVADDCNCQVMFQDQDPYAVDIDDMYLFFIAVVNLQHKFSLVQLYPDSGWPFVQYKTSMVVSNPEETRMRHPEFRCSMNRNAIVAKIRDLWRAHKSTVMSLQDLCIQYTRASMRDLSDETFSSLPVPPRLCRQLKLQDRADIVCAAYVDFLAEELSEVPV